MVLCGFSALTIMIFFFTLNIMKNDICIGNYTNLAFNEQSTISSCLTSSRTKQRYFQPVSFNIVANCQNYLCKQLKSTTDCHKYFKIYLQSSTFWIRPLQRNSVSTPLSTCPKTSPSDVKDLLPLTLRCPPCCKIRPNF